MRTPSRWQPSSGLDASAIFLTLFELPDDRTGALQDQASHVLSERERAEFDVIADPAIRCRRIFGRALARHVLGRYLGLSPSTIEIARDGFGKPVLDHAVTFSLSSRPGVVAIAHRSSEAIGIDIEVPVAAMVQRELACVLEPMVTQDLRDKLNANGVAPYGAWVALEAIRKASGDGLSDTGFQLDLAPGKGFLIRETIGAGNRIWRIHQFKAARQLSGCAAWAYYPDDPPREVIREDIGVAETALCLASLVNL